MSGQYREQHSPSWHDIEVRERLVQSAEDRRQLHIRLEKHDDQIEELTEQVEGIRSEVTTLVTWGKRVALLIALWLGALVANVGTDDKAELVAMLVKRLLNK